MTNFFADLPDKLPEELIEELIATPGTRIERIVSTGQASPDGFWYDQHEHEWVIVLRGSAGLQFQDPDEELVLQVGDHVHIPAHRKHRVAWTDPASPTVWLAVFFSSDEIR